MRAITRITLIAIFFILAGCSQHKVEPENASCVQSCKQRLKACQTTCTNSCGQCACESSRNAAKSFYKFKHQQCVQGGRIDKDLQSFRDPLKCAKTTCDCYADYRVCTQNCRGVIHKRLQVPPTCC